MDAGIGMAENILRSQPRRQSAIVIGPGISESADDCVNLLAIVERSATCPEIRLFVHVKCRPLPRQRKKGS